MNKNFLVKKWNGEEEIFDVKKFRISLERSGASKKIIDNIIEEIYHIIYNGISTQEIFKKAFALLKARQYNSSLRYNLANAISEMGPDGFSFEKFIGEVFQSYQYKPVYVGKKIKGKCVEHEIDIIAFKDSEHLTAELKFKNSKKSKTDLKVILYMKARFNDIFEAGYYTDKKPRQMIITNTKFTSNAKKYAQCANLEVLSWDFPYKNNLHDFILKSGIHPITALNTISQKAKKDLLSKKIVSCKSLLKNNSQEIKNSSFIPSNKTNLVEKEIKEICEALHLTSSKNL